MTVATELTTVEFVQRTRCTYRRIDYWARCGYLEPVGEAMPGSGHHRSWPVEEIPVARFLLRVVPLCAGRGHDLLDADAMRRLCDRVRRGDEGFVRIAHGVYVDLVEASS